MGLGGDPLHSDRIELGDAIIGHLRLLPISLHPCLLALSIHLTGEPPVVLVLLRNQHVAMLFLVGLELLQSSLPRGQRTKRPFEADRFKLGDSLSRNGGSLAFVPDPIVLALSIHPLSQSRIFLPLVGYIARSMLCPVFHQLLKALLFVYAKQEE